MKHSIAVVAGDGIGPEVINAGIQVLEKAVEKDGAVLDWTHFNWDSEKYKRTGEYIPKNGLDELKKYEAIFFGAVGAPGSLAIF
jgi:tartrate dehydrogenase/decarboxylase/D-malate dehydrogenase